MTQQKKHITKNQHFVPQFFQRFFSYENNGKTIGMFNTQLNRFKSNVPISSQLSSDYFYGKDGNLESWLSQLERDSAPNLQGNVGKRKTSDCPKSGSF